MSEWGDPGQPGSRQESSYRRQFIVTITVDNVSFLVHREVAPIFKAFLEELVGAGYSLDEVADDWGFANRNIRGSSQPSFHRTGRAIDINATANPQSSRLITNLPEWADDRAAEYGLYWGGNYRSRKDPMHFEFPGTIAEAHQIVHQIVSRKTNQEDDMANGEYLYYDQRTRKEWLCRGYMDKRYVDDTAELAFLQRHLAYRTDIPTQLFDSMRDVTP